MPKTVHDKLSEKEKAFAEEYLTNGLHRANAMLKASPGITRESARQLAFRALQRPHVKQYIEERLKDTILSTNQVLGGISGLAESAELDRDRLKAYELLGKHHKLFTEKSEIDINVSELTDDKLAALARG